MNLDRNQTALKIYQSLIIAHPNDYPDQLSKKAYQYADIFIKESQKQNSEVT
jgi:uncharacterized protein Veg